MKVSRILEQILLSSGAALVGFSDLTEIEAEARSGMRYGVTIGVALNPQIMNEIGNGPTKAYFEEYKQVNKKLDTLAKEASWFLQELSYKATAMTTTQTVINSTHSTALPHKTAATRAGLGWIGKSALLVTEEFGSAIRISTVLTNAPLDTGIPVNESKCGSCNACVSACPGDAPSGRNWRVGKQREDFFNVEACYKTAREKSDQIHVKETICGRCIIACPYTIRYLKKSAFK